MVAVLNIEKAADHPPENIIEQNLNTWVKASGRNLFKLLTILNIKKLSFITLMGKQESNPCSLVPTIPTTMP